MNSSYDCIIIGSGASGVSAAWPLVKANLRVAMVDQGREGASPATGTESFLEKRVADPAQWVDFLGRDFSGLGADGNESPKFKVPAHRFVLSGFQDAYSIASEGVHPTGSLAKGGVTRMWGAGPYNYRGIDLARFPLDPEALDASHRAVAVRIGINGVGDDALAPWLGDDLPLQAPMPLHENARRVLDRYQRNPALGERTGVRLGRARNAVVSIDQDGREACAEDGMCFWGCRRNAIYSADREVAALEREPNFDYFPGAFVSHLESVDGGYRVHCRDLEGRHEPRVFSAPKVLLAAGTIASTALALDLLGAYDTDVPLICHPAFAMLFLLPERLGSPLSNRGFALGQLAYLVEDAQRSADYAFGVVFAMEGLLAQEVIRYMPLTRPGAVKLTRRLMPSLLVANGYLSGDYGGAQLRLKSKGEGVCIQGGYLDSFRPRMRWAAGRLGRLMRSLGAWVLPTGIRIARLGSDGHFAGTLPMTLDERPLTTTPNAELRGAPGVYLVDGASIPYLSGKHPTFTMMANADRVAKHLTMQETVRG